jgi:NTP pyrophosphatase (non-canonical NTP hydrolase)
VDINDYQEMAGRTAQYPDAGGMGGLTYTVLGLASEAGELAGKLKKVMRDDGGVISEEKRIAIAMEVSDVLWYCAMTAKELGLTLSQIAEWNIAKLRDRKERGVITGSGDTR